MPDGCGKTKSQTQQLIKISFHYCCLVEEFHIIRNGAESKIFDILNVFEKVTDICFVCEWHSSVALMVERCNQSFFLCLSECLDNGQGFKLSKHHPFQSTDQHCTEHFN